MVLTNVASSIRVPVPRVLYESDRLLIVDKPIGNAAEDTTLTTTKFVSAHHIPLPFSPTTTDHLYPIPTPLLFHRTRDPIPRRDPPPTPERTSWKSESDAPTHLPRPLRPPLRPARPLYLPRNIRARAPFPHPRPTRGAHFIFFFNYTCLKVVLCLWHVQ